MSSAEVFARKLDRRKLLLGAAGVAAGASSIGALAEAAGAGVNGSRGPLLPAPRPIASGTDLSGFGLAPPLDFIHIRTPGPIGVSTPHNELPLEGLDIEPGTVGDFRGNVARAYLVGSSTATGSDGKSYDVEIDLGVNAGRYIDVNGQEQRGAFALM